MSDKELMTFPIEVTLKKEVVIADSKITQISFREPDGSDCMAFARCTDDHERVAVFFDRLSNVKTDTFARLNWRDYATCEEIANRFFGVYQSVSGFSLTALLKSPSFLEAVSRTLNGDPSRSSPT